MVKLIAFFFSIIALSANAKPGDNWPDASLILVNDSGFSIQVSIPQQLGLAKKYLSLRDDENQKVTVKIPMDATIELSEPMGRAKTGSCEVNLGQVLDEGKNEITISAAFCANGLPTLSCRQSRQNK